MRLMRSNICQNASRALALWPQALQLRIPPCGRSSKSRRYPDGTSRLAGIVDVLKERDEVHEHRDIALQTGDLLLANCPQICRSFYPRTVIDDSTRWVNNLGAMTTSTAPSPLSKHWKPTRVNGRDAANRLAEIRMDSEYRHTLLCQIRQLPGLHHR